MDWQTPLVIAIELAALAFLANRFFGRGRVLWPRSKRATKPDVPLASLVRKRR
jgi:hypothetical protein